MASGAIPKQELPIGPRCLSLSAELLLSDKLSTVSKQDINKAAVILAHTLLQLHDDNEGPRCWSQSGTTCNRATQWTEQVYFFENGDSVPKLYLQHPFLLTEIKESISSTETSFDDCGGNHPFPSILALGVTLLKMQLKHLGLSYQLETLFDDSDDDDEDDRSNPNVDLMIADTLLNEHRKSLDEYFADAIEACLDLAISRDTDIKTFIYEKIISPLEVNNMINPSSPEQIQSQMGKSLWNAAPTGSQTHTAPGLATTTEAVYSLDDGKLYDIESDKYVNCNSLCRITSEVTSLLDKRRPKNGSHGFKK